MKHNVKSILQNNPEFIRELIILLGVIELCKIIEIDSFENLINSYDIKSNHWWPLLNEVIEDDQFIEIVEGPLYDEILKLQMWVGNHKHNVIQGSLLWHLLKTDKLKK